MSPRLDGMCRERRSRFPGSKVIFASGVEMPLHNKWEVLNSNCPEFYPIIWVSFNEHILTAILKGGAVGLGTSTEALPQTAILDR